MFPLLPGRQAQRLSRAAFPMAQGCQVATQLQQETALSPCLRSALSEFQAKRTSMEGSSPRVRYAIGAAYPCASPYQGEVPVAKGSAGVTVCEAGKTTAPA